MAAWAPGEPRAVCTYWVLTTQLSTDSSPGHRDIQNAGDTFLALLELIIWEARRTRKKPRAEVSKLIYTAALANEQTNVQVPRACPRLITEISRG